MSVLAEAFFSPTILVRALDIITHLHTGVSSLEYYVGRLADYDLCQHTGPQGRHHLTRLYHTLLTPMHLRMHSITFSMVPRLNYDVLCCVMQNSVSISPATTSAMMRTCRALYAYGVTIFLSHEIPIRQASLRSYVDFVQHDGGRYHLVKALSLGSLALTTTELFHNPVRLPELAETYQALKALIPRLTSLERVVFNTATAISDLSQYNAIFARVVALESIRHLTLIATPHILAILPRMKSRLFSLDLTYWAHPKDFTSARGPYSFSKLLGHSRSTLRRLTLRNVSMRAAPGDPPFLRVEELRISCRRAGDLQPGAWARTFPNLRRLRFSTARSARAAPTYAARETHVGEEEQRTCWAALEEVRTSVRGACALAARVDTLCVRVPQFPGTGAVPSEERLNLLGAVVAATAPRVVEIAIVCRLFGRAAALRVALAGEAWACVEELRIAYAPPVDVGQLEAFVVCFYSLLLRCAI